MDIPSPLDTAKYRQLVLQGIGSLIGGGSVSDSNVAVASDGTTRAPLNLDSSGRLIVDIGSSVQIDQVLVDLTAVENKQDTSNALLTTIQSDLAGTLNGNTTLTAVKSGVVLPVSLVGDSLAAIPASLTAAVSLAGNQTLTAALANGSTLSSSISNFPAIQNVSLVGDSLAAIPASLTSAVSIAGGQSLTSARSWNLAASTDSLTAAVSSIPSVSLASGQNVGVSSLPAVSIASGQSVSLAGSSATIPVSVVGGSSGLVTLNGGYGTNATLPAYETIVGGTVTLGSGTANIGNVNSDSSGSGSVTPSTPLVITTTNNGTLGFQSNNAATGTVTIEGTVDGTTWTATTYVALTTGNSSSNFNAATPTIGQINTSALQAIRFRSNTITGTCGITYNLSRNVSNVMIDNALPSGSNLIGSVSLSTVSGLGTSSLTPVYDSIVGGSVTLTSSSNPTLGAGTNAIGYLANPSTFTAGQQVVTASAAALPSATLTTGIVLTNNATATVYLGTSGVTSSTGYALVSGASIGLAVQNLNVVYIIGTASTGSLSYIGS